jgi:hypothetical protein
MPYRNIETECGGIQVALDVAESLLLSTQCSNFWFRKCKQIFMAYGKITACFQMKTIQTVELMPVQVYTPLNYVSTFC